MTSRSTMDRPAQVTAALFGVALIGVSLLLFVLVDDEASGNRYTITWSETEHASTQGALAGAGSVLTLTVPVTDAQPSNATIEFPTCTDGATAPVQQAATISWSIFEGDGTTAIDSGTTTCAAASVVRVRLAGHADIGEVTADSDDEAKEMAEDDGARSTSYRLETQWSRQGAPGGLPLPAPAFSATAKLTVLEWVAAANPVPSEVAK